MTTEQELGLKSLDAAELRRLARTSVLEVEPPPGPFPPTGLVYLVAGVADDVTPWGGNVQVRDQQLRSFLTSESVTNSAIASAIARNMGFTWYLDGPKLSVDIAHHLLHTANFGAGWLEFIAKLCWDLYTQDKGAFVEIIREGNSPSAPVLGIQTLDAQLCWHTGNPEHPVIYLDKTGHYHKLAWYQVVTLAEMPAPHERLYGLQYSALTRILRAAQTFRNIQTYVAEKTGGRHSKALHLISGVNKNEVQGALDLAQAAADARGTQRFMQPAIVTAISATAKIDVGTLELSTLPDGFDAEQTFKQFLTVVSMGLLTDFQEFAPLPGGNLGTSMQSEILNLKSRGKGPMLFRKLIEHMLNFAGILPSTVTFRYDESDAEAEKGTAEVRKIQAETWSILVTTGAIDGAGVRQLALDAGHISQELFDEMAKRDLEAEQAQDLTAGVTAPDTGGDIPGEGDVTPEEERTGGKDRIVDPRTEAEREFAKRIETVFARTRTELRERIGRATQPDVVRKGDLDELRKEMTEAVTKVATAIATAPPTRTVKRIVRDEHGRIAGVEEVQTPEEVRS